MLRIFLNEIRMHMAAGRGKTDGLILDVQPHTQHRGVSLPDLLSCSWDKLRKLFSLRWSVGAPEECNVFVSLQIHVVKTLISEVMVLGGRPLGGNEVMRVETP